MFGFDERYAMFDMTAVDNQFILEYMPSAKGDHVKVYLYGLMQCYHPQTDMSLEQMSRELSMSEEELLAAYRYWERKGLVQRVSDHPPMYRYVNVKQLVLSGAMEQPDADDEAFTDAVYAVFHHERRVHGKELQMCYEWVEEMGLPREVVISLLEHMRDTKGKNFTFKAAEKLAMELADAGIRTQEDANHYLQLEKDVLRGSKEVLQRLGQYRNPTVDELNLYRTWLKDWGFKPDAILEACADTTGGKPNFKYLNGILKRYHEQDAVSGAQLREKRESGKEAIQPLKLLLGIMNLPTLTINDDTKAKYAKMRELYTDDVIHMAASECAGRGLGFDDVLTTLQAWKRQGLAGKADIETAMKKVNQQNAFLTQLFELWGRKNRPAAADRTLLTRWMEEWNLSEDVIITAAGYAKQAEKPMVYLDKVLADLAGKDISTAEQVAANHDKRRQQKSAAPAAKPGKTVREQQYQQREYQENNELPAWMRERIKEMNSNA